MADENKVRYSDDELEDFRKLVQDKIDKAENDLHLLRETFANDQGNGTNDRGCHSTTKNPQACAYISLCGLFPYRVCGHFIPRHDV